MLRLLGDIRTNERAAVFAAFATLFGVMASHALLETARDALFLQSIPARRLPWVYLAIALVSLALTRLRRPAGRPARAGTMLTGLLGTAAMVSLGFWWFLGAAGVAGLYALYL